MVKCRVENGITCSLPLQLQRSTFSDDYDSPNLEDEVDDFSSFFLDSVTYSGEESSSESDAKRSDCSSDFNMSYTHTFSSQLS